MDVFRGSPLDLLIVLFILGLVPLLAVSATSFTRIVVVLGLLRASLGTPSLPPNAVIAALAVMLSALVMAPTFGRINTKAIVPYQQHHLSASVALERGAGELKAFMLRQTRRSDIAAFARYAGVSLQDGDTLSIPISIVAPAFMVGELRAAFAIGFAFALPFAAIDVIVATIMMSLGMFMVPPATLALPVKLLLFVAADGWSIVCGSLIQSFR
ncbi:MAG: EscR/YscR/HrcR family type III secretion system export apparatus protein [Candidatus Eremiobacteraeota bacterium]|nr:EscR/YscR/HrcR family type III secretion system export apparatus protein [Candidatus Eremiobacteraeota bacterium]MBV8364953.1 EscR/YscR/HrcR family type III secretion system export apparatus protein [Candidatus Eremiobacteraeota bacterium]